MAVSVCNVRTENTSVSYILERQNNFISCTKLALRDFEETSVTKLQALHFIWYCFISQEMKQHVPVCMLNFFNSSSQAQCGKRY